MSTCKLLGLVFATHTGAGGMPIKGSSRDLPRKTIAPVWRGGAGLGCPSSGGGAVPPRKRPEAGTSSRGRAMADALRLRTACVLTDYLQYCTREPGSAPRPPSTPEAAVLRSVATHIQQRYQHVWSHYRGYRGNRIELVTQVAHEIFHGSRGPTWGRVVALVTFAGTLLERPPPGHTLALKEWEADVDGDCQSLVSLLCDWLTGPHRAWLEAQGGWVSGAGNPGTRLHGPHPEGPNVANPEGVQCEFWLSPLLTESGWQKPAFLHALLLTHSEAAARHGFAHFGLVLARPPSGF